MGLRFLIADKVTDPASAERVLTKYKNRMTSMSIDSQSFEGTILGTKADRGTLRVKFTWSKDQDQGLSDIEHIQRFAKTKIGSMVRFKVGTDEFLGLLSGITDLPEGATPERYVDSPFIMTFAFTAQDQEPVIADAEESGIIGVPVPTNISDRLPLDPDLPYDPHITVCFFPKLSTADVEKVLPLALEAAETVGSFDIVISGCTTFPTPQEDGTYPHVALIKSQGLTDFHDLFVELCEHHYPGLVDTKFARKNYTPHVTLSYQKDPSAFSIPKALAWNVDHLTLNLGKKDKFPIPLSEGSLREGSVEKPYLQINDVQIPIHIIHNTNGAIKLRGKNAYQTEVFQNLDGEKIKLVTDSMEQEMEILEVREMGPNEFQLFYRSLGAYMPKAATSKLQFVAAVAKDRGQAEICLRLSKLLNFDKESREKEEPDDKEALGPAFPGTDQHIVTYVKAPQTQVIVKEPKFTRSLPLHERI